jgi:tetratricopeptide (TPR) repeat protein
LALAVSITACGIFMATNPTPANAQEDEVEEADGADGADEEMSGAEIAAMLEEANSEARKRRYRKAIPLYKTVLQAAPAGNANVYFNLAEIKKFLEDCGEARILYRRYLELAPGSGDEAAVKKAINACPLAKIGKLKVEVEGAKDVVIILSDIPIATKPKADVEVKPGKYELIVRAEGFKTSRSQVEVLGGDDRTVSVKLEKRTFFGKLSVKVNVDGATVSVDDSETGVSPVEVQTLPAGKHNVLVRLEGYHDWVRNVVVGGGEDYKLSITLSKLEKK